MAFPNQPNNVGVPVGNQAGLTNQQLSALLNLLGQQPQANPTSSSFNPTYFSNLMNLANQPANTQPNQSQSTPPPQKSPSYIIVRTVDDPSVIEAQEVSMGVSNVFPSSDGEKIYIKTWNKDGLIDTSVFVYQKDGSTTSRSIDEPMADLEKRVSALETSVAKLKKQKAPKASKPRPTRTAPKQETIEEEKDHDE